MQNEIIRELEKHFGKEHEHLFFEGTTISMPPQEWEKQKRPYLWVETEKYKEYTLYDDLSRGYLLLIRDNKIVNIGKDFVSNETATIVGLGPCYTRAQPKLFILPEKP